MQAYMAEINEIFRRYRAGEISRTECIISLDVAFAVLAARLEKDKARTIRCAIFAGNKATLEKITKWRRKKRWAPRVARYSFESGRILWKAR